MSNSINVIEELMLYKNKNKYYDTDIKEIASLVRKLGSCYPDNLAKQRAHLRRDASLAGRFNGIKVMSEDNLRATVYSKVCDIVLHNDVLYGIAQNFTTGPYSHHIPLAISNPEGLISKNTNYINEVYQDDIEHIIQKGRENPDSFLYVIKDMIAYNLESHYRYFEVVELFNNLTKNIIQYDTMTNSIFYLIEDTISANSEYFLHCLSSQVKNEAISYINNNYTEKIDNLTL